MIVIGPRFGWTYSIESFWFSTAAGFPPPAGVVVVGCSGAVVTGEGAAVDGTVGVALLVGAGFATALTGGAASDVLEPVTDAGVVESIVDAVGLVVDADVELGEDAVSRPQPATRAAAQHIANPEAKRLGVHTFAMGSSSTAGSRHRN